MRLCKIHYVEDGFPRDSTPTTELPASDAHLTLVSLKILGAGGKSRASSTGHQPSPGSPQHSVALFPLLPSALSMLHFSAISSVEEKTSEVRKKKYRPALRCRILGFGLLVGNDVQCRLRYTKPYT